MGKPTGSSPGTAEVAVAGAVGEGTVVGVAAVVAVPATGDTPVVGVETGSGEAGRAVPPPEQAASAVAGSHRSTLRRAIFRVTLRP